MSLTAINVSILILCVALSGCLSNRQFISTEEKFSERKIVTGFHTVEPGETLFSIAWTYGWDYQTLARANKIGKPYIIYKGQKIDVANPPPVKQQTLALSVTKPSKPAQRKETTARVNTKTSSATTKPPLNALKPTWYWPSDGRMIGRFSANDAASKGIDLAGELGESVMAAATGTVVYAGKGLRGYGNLVIIKHNTNFLSAYAHASKILVREKEKIKAGQKIAEIGSTGTDKTKLHFEIRRNGRPVDPIKYLPRRNKKRARDI